MTGTIDARLSPVAKRAVIAIPVVEAFDAGIAGFVTLLAWTRVVAGLACPIDACFSPVAELTVVTLAIV